MVEPFKQSYEQKGFLVDLRTGFRRWRTRDLLIIIVVSIIFGLILTALSYTAMVAFIFGPALQWVWNGFWIIAPIFIAYALRRPSAAFLTCVLCELVMFPFVPYSFLGLVRGIMYGLILELVIFFVTKYHSFSLVRMVLIGAISGILIFLGTTAVVGPIMLGVSILDYTPWVLAGAILTISISSVICSILARLIANFVARTGVLSQTALDIANRGEI